MSDNDGAVANYTDFESLVQALKVERMRVDLLLELMRTREGKA